MNQSTDFIGQPIFSHFLSLLDQSIFSQSFGSIKLAGAIIVPANHTADDRSAIFYVGIRP